MLGSARDEAAPLLGRVPEQSLLTSLLDAVGDHGQALVLRGEPGIGKSRLLSVAEDTARERGMTVLTATGVQSEANLPFAGLHQLLRPVRERAAEPPPIQRDALDAAFGLTREVAPEHYRIAMASLDLVSDVAMPRHSGSPNGCSTPAIRPTIWTLPAWAWATSQRPQRSPAARSRRASGWPRLGITSRAELSAALASGAETR